MVCEFSIASDPRIQRSGRFDAFRILSGENTADRLEQYRHSVAGQEWMAAAGKGTALPATPAVAQDGRD